MRHSTSTRRSGSQRLRARLEAARSAEGPSLRTARGRFRCALRGATGSADGFSRTNARTHGIGQRKLRALHAYGGACECCGETDPDVLTIDHSTGGGARERREIGEGTTFYWWLEKNGFPKENHRLLCRSCNAGRGHNGGVCPHEGHINQPERLICAVCGGPTGGSLREVARAFSSAP